MAWRRSIEFALPCLGSPWPEVRSVRACSRELPAASGRSATTAMSFIPYGNGAHKRPKGGSARTRGAGGAQPPPTQSIERRSSSHGALNVPRRVIERLLRRLLLIHRIVDRVLHDRLIHLQRRWIRVD